MSKYRMNDGTVVSTGKAQQSWEEAQDWDGRNHISRATGSQWEHQTLYLSSRGRYYVVHSSDWQGSRSWAEWVSPEEAARWLVCNDEELPEDLKRHEAEAVE